MSELKKPEDEPMFQDPAVREVHWALELAASPRVSAGEAEQIWRQVRRRISEPRGVDMAGAVRRWRDGLAQGWREVTATLVQEALIPSPAVRGAETAQPALVVYETGDFAISLTFSAPPETERLRLIGQVVPKTASALPPGGQVVVWSERETRTGEVNENGEFAIEGVPRGELHMDILIGDDAIQLSPVPTRSSRNPED